MKKYYGPDWTPNTKTPAEKLGLASAGSPQPKAAAKKKSSTKKSFLRPPKDDEE